MSGIPSGFALERLIMDNSPLVKKEESKTNSYIKSNTTKSDSEFSVEGEEKETEKDSSSSEVEKDSSSSSELFEKTDQEMQYLDQEQKEQRDIDKKLDTMQKNLFKTNVPKKERKIDLLIGKKSPQKDLKPEKQDINKTSEDIKEETKITKNETVKENQAEVGEKSNENKKTPEKSKELQEEIDRSMKERLNKGKDEPKNIFGQIKEKLDKIFDNDKKDTSGTNEKGKTGNQAKTEDKPITENTQAKTEDKPITENTQAKTEDKPITGNTQAKTEDKPITGNTQAKTEDKPITENTQAKTEDKPITDGTAAKTDDKTTTDGTAAKTDGKTTTDGTAAKTDGKATTDGTAAKTDGKTTTDGTAAKTDDKGKADGSHTRGEDRGRADGPGGKTSERSREDRDRGRTEHEHEHEHEHEKNKEDEFSTKSKEKQEETKQQFVKEKHEENKQEKEVEKKEGDKKQTEEIRQQKIEEKVKKLNEEVTKVDQENKKEEKKADDIKQEADTKKQESEDKKQISKKEDEKKEEEIQKAEIHQEQVHYRERNASTAIQYKNIKLSNADKKQVALSQKMEAAQNLKKKAETDLGEAYEIRSNAAKRRKESELRLKKILENRNKKSYHNKINLDTMHGQGEINKFQGQRLSAWGEDKLKIGKGYKTEFEFQKEYSKNSLDRASNYETLAKWKLSKAEDMVKSGGSKNVSDARLIKEEAESLMRFAATNKKEGRRYLNSSIVNQSISDTQFKEGMSFLREGDQYTKEGGEIYKDINYRHKANRLDIAKTEEEVNFNIKELSFADSLEKTGSSHVSLALVSINEREDLKKMLKEELSMSMNDIQKEIDQSIMEKQEIGNATYDITEGRESLKKAVFRQEESSKKRNEAVLIGNDISKLNKKGQKKITHTKISEAIITTNKGVEELAEAPVKRETIQAEEGKDNFKKDHTSQKDDNLFKSSDMDFTKSESQLTKYQDQLENTRYQWEEKRTNEQDIRTKFSKIDYEQNTYQLSDNKLSDTKSIEQEQNRSVDDRLEKNKILSADPENSLKELRDDYDKNTEKQTYIKQQLDSIGVEGDKSKEKLKHVDKIITQSEENGIGNNNASIKERLGQSIEKKEIEGKEKSLVHTTKTKGKQPELSEEEKKEIKRLANDTCGIVKKIYGGNDEKNDRRRV